MTSIEKKTKLISYFLERGEWDLFLTAFRESHWVGHQCWHLHDSNHPEHDQKILNALGNPLQDIYIAIDSALAQILQQLDSETTVFIFASTGMGPNYTGIHILDEVLLRIENSQTTIEPQKITNTVKFLEQYKLIRKLKNRIWKPILNLGEKSKLQDKSNRQCFQVPSSEAFGAIRLNIVGREPDGKIQPGREYETFCKALSKILLELVNLDTGELIIKRIFFSDDLYQGEQPMGVPDLLVEWNRNAPISSVYSPQIGRIDKVYWDSRTGDHKPGGLFCILGPSIKPGRIEQPTSIVDFAPTISSLLDCALPYMDGKIISTITGEK